jgi:hypothetical protein
MHSTWRWPSCPERGHAFLAVEHAQLRVEDRAVQQPELHDRLLDRRDRASVAAATTHAADLLDGDVVDPHEQVLADQGTRNAPGATTLSLAVGEPTAFGMRLLIMSL